MPVGKRDGSDVSVEARGAAGLSGFGLARAGQSHLGTTNHASRQE